MSFLGKLWDKILNRAGESIGQQEMGSDLRYPVKPYDEWVDQPHLARGSRPAGREDDLTQLYRLRGAVNLCAEPCRDAWPSGVAYLEIPVVDNTAPLPEQVDEFLAFVVERAPVYVHCEAGQGRTGVFAAAYRVKVQGWSPEAALTEARRKGLAIPAQAEFILGLRSGLR